MQFPSFLLLLDVLPSPSVNQVSRGTWTAQSIQKHQWAAVGFVPPKKSYPKNKESACASWAMWCSPSCPGTSETNLQPTDPLVEWPSEWWPPGSSSHDKEGLHGGQLHTRCLFVKGSYRIWILFGIGFWLWSHLVSKLQASSSVNLRWLRERTTKCLQPKAT